MNYILGHNDNKKERSNSHSIEYLELPIVYLGEGKNKEEAFKHYKEQFGIYLDEVQKMYRDLSIDRCINVDWKGDIL